MPIEYGNVCPLISNFLFVCTDLSVVIYRKIWHMNKIKQCRMQCNLENTAPTYYALPMTFTRVPHAVPITWALCPSLLSHGEWLHAVTQAPPKPFVTPTASPRHPQHTPSPTGAMDLDITPGWQRTAFFFEAADATVQEEYQDLD